LNSLLMILNYWCKILGVVSSLLLNF
jgi:hypothetical protein